MRPLLLLSAFVMLATAPLATASCHGCLEAVVEDCETLSTDDCVQSAGHAATHLPAHALEAAKDPAGFVCDVANDPGCS